MAYEVVTERQAKPRSGVAMGGLGCGWFELRQDGICRNWNIFNNRPLGRGSEFHLPGSTMLFFLLRFEVEGMAPCLRLLQIEDSHDSAGFSDHEFHYIFPWLDGMDRIEYRASFPFVNLTFSEASMPLAVSLEAWSPFIPRDVKNSSLPAAVFRFKVRSQSPKPVRVSLLATLRNAVGYDVPLKSYRNRATAGSGWRGLELGAADMDPAHASHGTMSLLSLHEESTRYIGWEHPHPYYERVLREPVLPEYDDTAGRNRRDAQGRAVAMERCFATVGRNAVLQSEGESFEHDFIFSWHFPNQYARLPADGECGPAGYLEDRNFPGHEAPREEIPGTAEKAAPALEGHLYANSFSDATEVAAYVSENLNDLETRTRGFHEAFFASTIEPAVLDQVNSHLNTFRTSSWLTRQGNFGILEGLGPRQSFAGLATMDVAMYGHVATAALFPELDRAVMRAHRNLQNENGSVIHSISQNFQWKDPSEASGLRLDMPAQYVVMALRGFFWSGDRAYLQEMWPSVCAALDYVLRERDPNGDGLPDMEGVMCSYDNFPMYGIAPYVASQWLAAVTAAAEAAGVLGDSSAAERYRDVVKRGTAALEKFAWNGSYYRLYADPNGTHGLDEGCLTDQVLGQWAAHLVDLAPLLAPERVQSALAAVLRMNFRPAQGLRNCQWPGDGFLHDVPDDCWVDQANTCWSGVELAFASLLLYEGMAEEGLEIVRNVDARYRRWGMYWDHQEFGGHYFRPMSAWAIMPALLGQKIRDGVVTFDPRLNTMPLRVLFTTPHGYGHLVRTPSGIRLEILSGSFQARELRFGTAGQHPTCVMINGNALPLVPEIHGSLIVLQFAPGIVLHEGDVLSLIW